MLTLALNAFGEARAISARGQTGAAATLSFASLLACFAAPQLPLLPTAKGRTGAAQDRGAAHHHDMTAAPTKPRALRRLSQLHDAKSLGRDKELARRLQKGSAEPSPQSYKEQPRSPPGGRFTGKAPRPARYGDRSHAGHLDS